MSWLIWTTDATGRQHRHQERVGPKHPKTTGHADQFPHRWAHYKRVQGVEFGILVVSGLWTKNKQISVLFISFYIYFFISGIVHNLLLIFFWSALQNPQEYHKKESGGSLTRQLSNSSRSSSSHPSTPLKPNTAPNGSPAHKPNKHAEVSMIQKYYTNLHVN